MKLYSSTRLFGAAAAVLISASLIHAQDAPPPEKDGPRKSPTVEERIDRMKKDLAITEDQVTKIKPILEDARAQMDKLREEADGDRTAIREKGRELMEASRAKIDEILTPDQKAKADELRSKRQGARGEGESKKKD